MSNPYREEAQRQRARGNPNAYDPPESHDIFLHNDPLLRACWDAGLEPNDVILEMAKRARIQQKMLERACAVDTSPLVIAACPGCPNVKTRSLLDKLMGEQNNEAAPPKESGGRRSG